MGGPARVAWATKSVTAQLALSLITRRGTHLKCRFARSPGGMSNAEADRPQPSPGYEVQDIKTRPLIWLAASVAGGAAVVHLALWLYLHTLRQEQQRAEQNVSPLANLRPLPPAPRLQEAPAEDYQRLREAEETVLNTYGWVDRDKGVVRLPIERAMELLIERSEPKPADEQSQEQGKR